MQLDSGHVAAAYPWFERFSALFWMRVFKHAGAASTLRVTVLSEYAQANVNIRPVHSDFRTPTKCIQNLLYLGTGPHWFLACSCLNELEVQRSCERH
jgi:hypothetical protein